MLKMLLGALAVAVVSSSALVVTQDIGTPHSATYITNIIIIPAGVPHGWTDIPDHVDYLSFRPSPGILTAGWTSPAIQK